MGADERLATALYNFHWFFRYLNDFLGQENETVCWFRLISYKKPSSQVWRPVGTPTMPAVGCALRSHTKVLTENIKTRSSYKLVVTSNVCICARVCGIVLRIESSEQ